QHVNQQEADWHDNNGICDCFTDSQGDCDCGQCFMGSCCPCILLNKTDDMLHRPNEEPSGCGAVGCGWCVLNMCGGWGMILGCLQRRDIRKEYNIGGSWCGDACCNFCLPCCAVIQQHKEVKMRVKPTGNRATNVPYQGQPQMR
ncbi:hypothetical protein N658DRAFT_402370, partial [Parathielavia hyrcaniae]